jgi:hypothetical protein
MTKKFMRGAYRDRQKAIILAEAEASVGALQHAARVEIETEELTREIAARRREIERLVARRNGLARSGAGGSDMSGMPCPGTGCRGRLGADHRCGLCSGSFCHRCHGSATANHECREEDRRTVALLRENTRPCPGCMQGIFKTEGCDQMWCVSCHTCFSWSTGRVVRGTVHNPHYYEHRLRGGGAPMRNLGDIPCGGMPSVSEVASRLGTLFCEDKDEIDHMDAIFAYYRVVTHVNDTIMPTVYRRFQTDGSVRELGIRFLRNRITRDAWRDGLYALRLRGEKYRRYYEVLETMSHTTAELFRQLVVDRKASETRARCDGLFDALNRELDVIRDQYGMMIPVFSPEMPTD